MIFPLRDKIILITGASTGIGRALALACAHRGAKVSLAARSETRLHEVEKLISAYEKQAGAHLDETGMAGNRTSDIAGLREAGDELERDGQSETARKISSSLTHIIFNFLNQQRKFHERMVEQDAEFAKEMRKMAERAAERRTERIRAAAAAQIRRQNIAAGG